MSSAKKRAKRPPRRVWLVLDEYGKILQHEVSASWVRGYIGSRWRVVGPYLLDGER